MAFVEVAVNALEFSGSVESELFQECCIDALNAKFLKFEQMRDCKRFLVSTLHLLLIIAALERVQRDKRRGIGVFGAEKFTCF